MEGPFWFYYVARSTNRSPNRPTELILGPRLEVALMKALQEQGFVKPTCHLSAARDTWLVSVLVRQESEEAVEAAKIAIRQALTSITGSIEFIRCGSVPAFTNRPRAA